MKLVYISGDLTRDPIGYKDGPKNGKIYLTVSAARDKGKLVKVAVSTKTGP